MVVNDRIKREAQYTFVQLSSAFLMHCTHTWYDMHPNITIEVWALCSVPCPRLPLNYKHGPVAAHASSFVLSSLYRKNQACRLLLPSPLITFARLAQLRIKLPSSAAAPVNFAFPELQYADNRMTHAICFH